jgi:hypothetical protein
LPGAALAGLGLGARNGRATWRTVGLFVGFRRLVSICGGSGVGFFSDRPHFGYSLGRLVPRDDIDHFAHREFKANLGGAGGGDGMAMEAEAGSQMSAGERR